jgi:hypothetical protein
MSKVTTTFEAVDTGMVATIQKIERETKSMKDTTEKTEKQVDLSFSAMAKAGAGLAIGIGIVKGAFAALTNTLDQFGQALDMGGRLSDLSARTGETAGNLLLLERAFDNSGVGADKVGSSINKLQKFMSDANNGTTKNIEVLDQLGISYSTLAQLTPTEQMGLLAEKINEINSPTERAATAMTIFGKSGGALLPLLQNFSGEIGNAKDELGSMTEIMDAKSGVFDTVSDKITIIKGKFIEFAAGILDKVTPALELFTTILSRIDAAALGQKLADAFLGGQKAMEGFGAALDMLKIGEFSLAFDIAFTSIKLQAAQSANSIYANFKAAIAATAEFIGVAFGPGSGIFTVLTKSFEVLGYVFSRTILEALKSVGNSMSGIFDGPMGDLMKIVSPVSARLIEGFTNMGHVFDGAITDMGTKVTTASNEMKNAMGQIPGDFTLAAQETKKAFDESLKSAGQLIDITGMELDLQNKKTEALTLQNEMAKEAASLLSFNMQADVQKKSFDSLKELKTEYQLLAKEQPDPLKKMKETTEKITIKMEKIVEKVKELTLLEKLDQQLIEARTAKESKIKPLEEEFKKQIEGGKFKQAEMTMKQIEKRQEEAAIRIDEKGEIDRRDINAIAREEGIKTGGKSKEQIRKEILEKRKEKKPEEQKKEAEKKEAEKKEEEKKVEDKAADLFNMVKAIKELVAKIEPKLPTHALAL